MLFACIITNILAIALPSLRISPLLLIRIATIALLYAAALSFNVVYIQSIGSGIGNFSGLFPIANIYDISIALFSLVPVKPKRLTNLQKQQYSLPEELKTILVGLLLGDLCAQKQSKTGNITLRFPLPSFASAQEGRQGFFLPKPPWFWKKKTC